MFNAYQPMVDDRNKVISFHVNILGLQRYEDTLLPTGNIVKLRLDSIT